MVPKCSWITTEKMIELSQLSSSQTNEYYTVVIQTYGIITNSAKYWELATFCQHSITNVSLVWKFSWYSLNYYLCLFCHIITLLAHTQFAINYYCKIIYTSTFNRSIWLLLLERRTLHLSFFTSATPSFNLFRTFWIEIATENSCYESTEGNLKNYSDY